MIKGIMLCCFTALLMSVKAQNTIELIELASGFNFPLGIVHAGDERLFIIQKGGVIRLMDTTGLVYDQPFLDIDARVNSTAGERGLLGLAFHPNYADNGYFYVNYTNSSGNTVISRFSLDSTDGNLADPDSEMILFTEAQPFQNHNGGHLAFGPDGYLYIGLGDGGSGGDPGDRAQNLNTRLGKMLRLDVDGGTPYAIPPDNPFAGNDTILQEIWAYGLRNPWRYSFDRMTGDLWIADVGQDAWEEINFQPAASPGGENYGWRCKEGFVNFNPTDCPPPETLTDPVFVYAHTGAGCSGSVTGGFAYSGNRNPYLNGKYVFTDYCTGVFRAISRDSAGNFQAEVMANLQDGIFTAFGEDASGELYVAGANGRIYIIHDLVSSVSDLNTTELTFHPNPAHDWFELSGDISGVTTLRISDAYGRTLIQKEVSLPARIYSMELPTGIYAVSVIGKDQQYGVGKIVLINR